MFYRTFQKGYRELTNFAKGVIRLFQNAFCPALKKAPEFYELKYCMHTQRCKPCFHRRFRHYSVNRILRTKWRAPEPTLMSKYMQMSERKEIENRPNLVMYMPINGLLKAEGNVYASCNTFLEEAIHWQAEMDKT